jgi:rhodanese-related sulfurtransferase
MIKEISAAELHSLLQSGVQLIDVREPSEFEGGHVPRAISIPLASVPENIEQFRSANDVYVICHSGARSMRACEFLHDAGITNVINVAGGTSGWIALGNEVEAGA